AAQLPTDLLMPTASSNSKVRTGYDQFTDGNPQKSHTEGMSGSVLYRPQPTVAAPPIKPESNRARPSTDDLAEHKVPPSSPHQLFERGDVSIVLLPAREVRDQVLADRAGRVDCPCP